MMRWTAANLAKLAAMARDDYDQVEIAKAFGVSKDAIRLRAYKSGIRLKNGRPARSRDDRSRDEKLRDRWAKLLPDMKAALRASIGARP